MADGTNIHNKDGDNICVRAFYKLGTMWSQGQILNVRKNEDWLPAARALFAIPCSVDLEVHVEGEVTPGCIVVFTAVESEASKPYRDAATARSPPKKTLSPPDGSDMTMGEGAVEEEGVQGQVGFLNIGMDLFSTHSVLGTFHNTKVLHAVLGAAEEGGNGSPTHEAMTALRVFREIALREQKDWHETMLRLCPSPTFKGDHNLLLALDAAVEEALRPLTHQWLKMTPVGQSEVRPRILFYGRNGSGRTHMLRRIVTSVLIPHYLFSLTYVTTYIVILDWSKVGTAAQPATYQNFTESLVRCLCASRPFLQPYETNLIRFFAELACLTKTLPELSDDFVKHYPVAATYFRLLGMQIQTAYISSNYKDMNTYAGHLLHVIKDVFSFTHVTLLIDNAPSQGRSESFMGLLEAALFETNQHSCVLMSMGPISAYIPGGLLQQGLEDFLPESVALSLIPKEFKDAPVKTMRCPGFVDRIYYEFLGC